jgi:S-adenosylmethionine:tRNA ribosyltransferase-isomerase
MLTLDDFDFDLPGELIAQHPTAERTASRLLQLADGGLHDRRFSELPQWSTPAICWCSTIRA